MHKVTKLKISKEAESSIPPEGFEIHVDYFLRGDDRFDVETVCTSDEATALAVANILEFALANPCDDEGLIAAAMELVGMEIRIDEIDSPTMRPLRDGDVVTWLGDVLGPEESDYSSFGALQSYSVLWNDGKGNTHDVELVKEE